LGLFFDTVEPSQTSYVKSMGIYLSPLVCWERTYRLSIRTFSGYPCDLIWII